MKIFTGRKGIILHPGTWIVAAFILGMVLMYMVMKEIIPVPFLSC